MAIVVALNNKRQSRAGLSGVISYVANDRKTLLQSGEKLVSGINCSPHSAYDEFMLTKHLHSKTNGRYFYHYCQSFSPEEKSHRKPYTKSASGSQKIVLTGTK